MDSKKQWEVAGGEEERLQILRGLDQSEASAHLAIIYQALGDESWRVRKEAAAFFLALPQAAERSGDIIKLLYAEENAGLRNSAVEILVSLGRRAVPALLAEITCPDHDVRKFVLDILGDIGDRSSVPAMIAALADPDENVRAAAAENLGKTRSAEAVPALLDALRNSDLLFRFTILEALGQIGAEAPVARLLEFKDEPLLRKALFDCLGRIGGIDALPILIEGLSDRMRNVREAAVTALLQIGQSFPRQAESVLVTFAGSAEAKNIADFLASARAELKGAAVKLLGWVCDKRFARPLLEIFKEEEFREDAAAALVSLGKNDPDALIGLWPEASGRSRAFLAYLLGEARCAGAGHLLHEGLSSADAELRLLSARGLALLGDPGSLPALVNAIADPEPEVREAVMWALEQLGASHQQEIFARLQPLLADDDPEQRMSAVQILAKVDGAEVEKRLFLATKDESSQVRQAALRALDGRPGSEQMPALVLALTDEDSEVRRLAAELLGNHGDAKALHPLALALQDEDIWVRSTVVRALAQLPGPECLEMVQRALHDPVGLVVIAAIETLAAIDAERFLPQLIETLDHQDEEVVSAGLQLLAESGRRDWIEPVRDRLLNHRHWEVRNNFVRIYAMQTGIQCRPHLEARLLVEGEDLVRQQIQDFLADLSPTLS
ncbi:MAG: HEAT repeat domain-containing protein [Desulfuromonadales bacterium]